MSIIENTSYKSNQKYADWLARQKNISWKTKLCDDIDNIILREDVQSVEDLAERLREKYYAVTLKKYLSIKVSENRKAIRSYRLGDGYAIEELQYRISNKNREMSLSAVARYQGVQREYAICLRELQIMVYRKNENSHNVTYGELCRNAELLTYLCDNNICSDEDFRNVVNDAAEKSDSIKKSREKLLQEIEREEKILQDGARFVELNKIKMPTADQLNELAELSFLSKYKLRSAEDIAAHGKILEELKTELSDAKKILKPPKVKNIGRQITTKLTCGKCSRIMIIFSKKFGGSVTNWNRRSVTYSLKNQEKLGEKTIIFRYSAKCAKTFKKFVRVYH